jgi:hypothetical protein
MSDKSNVLENEWLLLLFNNTNAAGVGDATGLRGSTTAGSFKFTLHSDDPGEAGTQATNEIAYAGATPFARVAKNRAAGAGGFTVTANVVNPADEVTFPQKQTAGTVEALFWSLGDDAAGAGKIRYYGPIGGPPKLFVGAVSNTISAPAHGCAVNDRVFISALEGAGALPTGLARGVYFVLTAPDADSMTVSATQGGAVIDITVLGVGILRRIAPMVIGENTIPKLTTATSITEG